MGTRITTRRLAGITLAAALTLAPFALTSTAHAAQVAGGDITISAGAKGTVKDHTVKYVRIASYADVNYDEKGNPTGVDLLPALNDADNAKLTAAVAHVDASYDQAQQAIYTPVQWIALKWKGTDNDKYGNSLADNQNTFKLAKLLAGDDAAYSITDALSATASGANTDGKTITIPVDYGTTTDYNLGGLYLAIDQNKDDTSRKANAMLVPSPIQKQDGTIATTLGKQTLGQVNMKNQIVTITKQRTDTLPTIGSQVSFTINATGPDFTGIDDPKLTLWDNPSNGLDQPTAVSVKVDGQPYEAGTGADANWTLDLKSGNLGDKADAKDANAFSVSFAKPLDLQGKSIEVTYTTTVNEHALEQANDSGKDDTYANTATLQYSNDPWSDSTGTPHDTVEGPLAGLNLHKVELGNDTKDLTGARFQVAKVNQDKTETPVKFTSHTIDNVTTFVVDPNGTITDIGGDQLSTIAVEGLDRGTYKVTETKAPANHVLGQGDRRLNFTVTVTAPASTHDRQDVTLTHDAGAFAKFVAVDTADKSNETLLVRNATSFDQLPATGSTGIMIAAGAILVLTLGAGLTVASKRMNHAR